MSERGFEQAEQTKRESHTPTRLESDKQKSTIKAKEKQELCREVNEEEEKEDPRSLESKRDKEE